MSNLINTIKNNDTTDNIGLVVVATLIVPFLTFVVIELLNGATIHM
jgi:hypothetical protein